MDDQTHLDWNNALYQTSFRYEKMRPRRANVALEAHYKEREGETAARDLKVALKKETEVKAKSEWDQCDSSFWERRQTATARQELSKEEKLAAKAIINHRREALKKLYDFEFQAFEKEEKTFDSTAYNQKNQ